MNGFPTRDKCSNTVDIRVTCIPCESYENRSSNDKFARYTVEGESRSQRSDDSEYEKTAQNRENYFLNK